MQTQSWVALTDSEDTDRFVLLRRDLICAVSQNDEGSNVWIQGDPNEIAIEESQRDIFLIEEAVDPLRAIQIWEEAAGKR